ncbi:hypothetical protein [Maricaulis maris]|uniref:hypothetical protein n=1 Tax=Maricaulis maris TaxID=74318 RepID=UPI0026EB73E5|nr:hypothetical protein [Maricaulis maris]
MPVVAKPADHRRSKTRPSSKPWTGLGAIVALWSAFHGLALAEQDAWPAPLATAFASAVETEADRRENWRFLADAYTVDGPLALRFDGEHLDVENGWSLVSPSMDGLTAAQRTAYAEIISPDEDEDDAGGLFLAMDAAELIGGEIQLLAETDSALTYTFTPYLGPEEMDIAIARHLIGQVSVRRDGSGLASIRLHAPERFRPHLVVRIDSFDLVMEFQRLDGLTAPVLRRLSSRIEGSAAFQDLDEVTEMTFSEVEYLGDTGRVSAND